jgi:hypothetical protein
MRHRLFPILFNQTSAVNPIAAVLAKFEGAGDDAGLAYSVVTGESIYHLYQHLGSRLYWDIQLGPEALGVGQETIRIETAHIRKLYLYHNESTTPAFSFSGSWVPSTNASAIGGLVRYASDAGRYIQLVTAAGVTSVGAQGGGGGNAGLALVSIDGDKTLASLLPTAQSLVDAGTYPNTILVANGGTLNPTDRVWEHYHSPAQTEIVWFTHSLTAGAHTVRITATGYKLAASTDSYVLVTAVLAHGAGYGSLADTNYYMYLQQNMSTAVSPPVWEISWNTKPTGATSTEWMGHFGSQKTKVANVVKVDGSTITPTNGNIYRGTTITITMQHSLRHGEIGGGATEIGVVDMVYSFNAVTGLTISYTITWSTNGTTFGFPAMYTIDKLFDRCKATNTAVETLDHQDEAVYANSNTGVIWAWDYDGYQACCMNLNLAVTVNNWADNPTGIPDFMGWKDMNAWQKAYTWPYPDTINYIIGQTQTSECNYRVQWFPNGANAALAGS